MRERLKIGHWFLNPTSSWASVLLLLPLMTSAALAERWVCPDSPDDSHHREVVATSAPEVKVRSAGQDDDRRWAAIVKPLTQKALRLARAQRALSIEEGIEHTCTMPQQYIAQIVPVAERTSGCDHRLVTRPADEGHLWVQVMATCRYDWNCCSREDVKGAARGSGTAAGYVLEGPLNPSSATPSVPAPSSTNVKSKK